MLRFFILISTVFFFQFAFALPTQHCSPPSLIKKIENYDIIATNTASISTAAFFKGNELNFSVKYHVRNKQNKVNMNSKTGVISIQAEKKDNFDVQVIAKNNCGKAHTTFNVQIDEDE